MTQIATIERLLDSSHAEIAVPRKSACGHDCEECAGCGVSGTVVRVRASNPIGALPGQQVVVQTDTRKMLKIAALVYLIPVVLFFAGYFFAAVLTTRTAVQYSAAAAGFVLGIALAIAYDRRLKKQGGLTFTIVRLF